MRAEPQPLDPGRILVLQLGHLGDAIGSRLAVHSMVRRFPRASVEWVVRESYAPLLASEPASAVHEYPRGSGPSSARAVVRLARRLCAPKIDLVVDVTGTPRARWLALAIGARRWAGWGSRYRLGTPDRRNRCGNYTMEIGRLVAAIGAEPRTELPPLSPPRPSAEAQVVLSRLRHPLVVMHLGAMNRLRRWPSERFTALARQLASRQCAVLMLAGPDDDVPLEACAAAAGGTPVAHRSTSISDLGALLGAADLYVGSDSGPLHLAVALGTPSVGLYGPDVPFRSRPPAGLLVCLDVPLHCRPCRQHPADCRHSDCTCMDRIAMDRVLTTALDLLAHRGHA